MAVGWGDDWGDNWGGGGGGGSGSGGGEIGVPEVTISLESKVRTPAAYASAFWHMLPAGQAFDRAAPELGAVIEALSVEWPRVELSAVNIAVELNPGSTVSLLPEWEAFAGLPDKCAGVAEDTLQGRRAALVAKVASVGGQSLTYFEDVARSLGYIVTCTNTLDPYVWQVSAPATTVIDFRAGRSRAGERLRSWGNSLLECKINLIKPAHTRALFVYT